MGCPTFQICVVAIVAVDVRVLSPAQEACLVLFGVVLEEFRFAEEPAAAELAHGMSLETSFRQRSIQVPRHHVHPRLPSRIEKLLAHKDLHRSLAPLSPEECGAHFSASQAYVTELLAQVLFDVPLE